MVDQDQDAFQKAERFIAIETSVIATAQALAIEMLANREFKAGDGTVAQVWATAYKTARELSELSEPLYDDVHARAAAMVKKPSIALLHSKH